MISATNQPHSRLPNRPQVPAFHIADPFEIIPLDFALGHLHNSIPHSHTHFEIVWITQGKVFLTIGRENFELNKDLVMYIEPGQVHSFGGPKNAEGFILSFRSEFFFSGDDLVYSRLLNNYSTTDRRHIYLTKINAAAKAEMTAIMLNMQKELQNPHFLQTDVLRGFLRIFLIYLTREIKANCSGTARSGNCTLSKKFFDLLENRYTVQHRVSEYADELSVTAGYLNDKIKRHSGFTASFNIQQRIITEAKRLLRYENLSLKEIAYKLGFEDTAHFSKFFKKASGCNFSEFKRKNGFSGI